MNDFSWPNVSHNYPENNVRIRVRLDEGRRAAPSVLNVHEIPFLEVTPYWPRADKNPGAPTSRLRLRIILDRNRSRHVEADRIVHRVGQGLFGAEIPLRSLDRGVTQQQLDLLQLPAGLSA
jgi:hypothetical protein